MEHVRAIYVREKDIELAVILAERLRHRQPHVGAWVKEMPSDDMSSDEKILMQ